MTRREFLSGTVAFAAMPTFATVVSTSFSSIPVRRGEKQQNKLIDSWDDATGLVKPKDYVAYMSDGDTCGFKALKDLEFAFDKVLREAKETVVKGDTPAVWSVYNMGYIVRTRKALFAIDLNHRRGAEFAPLLDFALVTHNHGDHWRRDFYGAMDSAGKTVVSNFLENKGAPECGYTSDEKVFKKKDVEIRTFRVDHATEEWGINFTTAFEMRVGNFRLLHTGDCGLANDKLRVKWGRPDLWLLFPMSSLDIADAMHRIKPRHCVFGHLWELGHAIGKGRACKPHICRALPIAKAHCKNTSVAFWGDRIV